ncbi:transcriptional repressor [bacterium]|nr:transcriptional repressor [bacterium]
MSRQKEIILDVLRKVRTHPTADEILLMARRRVPALALGTVYRNLKLLCDEKKVRRIPMEDAPDRYDGFLEPHDHLVCLDCGKVYDIPSLQTKEALEAKLGTEVRDYEMKVYFICPNCRREDKDGFGSPD